MFPLVECYSGDLGVVAADFRVFAAELGAALFGWSVVVAGCEELGNCAAKLRDSAAE